MKIVYNVCYGGFGLSKKAAEWLLDNGIEEPFKSKLISDLKHDIIYGGYCFDLPSSRSHPLLVKCVETLGTDIASGRSAKLAIAEISEEYYNIEDYDGYESVKTPEKYTWYRQI